MRFVIALLSALLLASAARAVPACSAAPLGLPEVPGAVLACHTGYASLVDPHRREPVLVAYVLTAAHAIGGCIPRTGLAFKIDPLVPTEDQGRPADYAQSGYDLGHLANNEDFAWDAGEQRDTFSMANVSPQLPGLNRMGWERGEDITRAIAQQRGAIGVFVGPVYGDKAPTIGADALPVPMGFFKVLVDPAKREVFAFVMKNQPIAKMADLSPFEMAIADIESKIGFRLPLPEGLAELRAMPAVDLAAWREAHREVCAK